MSPAMSFWPPQLPVRVRCCTRLWYIVARNKIKVRSTRYNKNNVSGCTDYPWPGLSGSPRKERDLPWWALRPSTGTATSRSECSMHVELGPAPGWMNWMNLRPCSSFVAVNQLGVVGPSMGGRGGEDPVHRIYVHDYSQDRAALA